jgi:RNA polymerase sigma-70 factor (ECF subfamily)
MGNLEQDFIEFSQTGSAGAMARLFDAAAPELLLIAGHLARDAGGAEDLVQETFLVAIEGRATFDPTRRVMPWLLGILVNLHRRERRRRESQQVPREALSKAPDPTRSAEDAELVEQLDRVLTALPANYGEPLRLRLIHGLEPVQIAHALGRPLETVRTQLRRGRELLREALPIGLVGAFALDFGLGTDGLAAMRELVLSRALQVSGASLAHTAGVGGLILMKKLLVALAIVVLVGASYVLTRPPQHPTPSPNATAAVPVVAVSDAIQEPDPSALEAMREVREPQAVPARTTSLSCRAVWDDGSPAAGIGIRLWCAERGDLGPHPDAVTDSAGKAMLEDIPAGAASLMGDRGGSVEIQIIEGEHHEVELRVPHGVHVRGTVVDTRDRPVGGAEIWISSNARSTYQGLYSGSTDSNGRFELRSVQAGRVVNARMRGFAKSAPWVVVKRPGEDMDITLRIGEECGRLHGVVRAPNGQSCGGAVLLVGAAVHHTRSGPDGKMFDPPPPDWLYSSEDGHFEVEVPMGAVTPLWARSAESAVWNTSVKIEKAETWIDIQLENAASISGRVIARNGEPVPKADVRAVQEGVEPEPHMAFLGPKWAEPATRSGVDGSFRLTNVVPGRTSLVAKSREQGNASVILDLVAGEEATCELIMGSAPSIGGIVVDEYGQPAAGIQVDGRAEIGGKHSTGKVLTGPDGTFLLSECTSERYTLQASDPNADVNPYVSMFAVVPGGAPARIVFSSNDRAASRITGRFVDRAGAPVTAGDVSLTRFGSDGATQWGGHKTTFEEGAFCTALLPAGKYLLSLREDELGTWTHTVELGPNQQLDLGELEISAPGRIELTLEGVFEPEMDATIYVEGAPWVLALEVRDGRGTSGPLQPGSYRVGFGGSRGPLGNQDVVVRSGESTVLVYPVGQAVRRMVRMPRVPVDYLVLKQTWMNADGRTVARVGWGVQRREADTPFEWLIVPGSYRVTVEALDGRKAETTFVVTEDPESEEVIELPSPVLN